MILFFFSQETVDNPLYAGGAEVVEMPTRGTDKPAAANKVSVSLVIVIETWYEII